MSPFILTHSCSPYEREEVLFGAVLTALDANKAAYDAQFKTDYFTHLATVIPEEVAKPLDIMTIKPIAGFASC
jgi:hypothetical protein